MLASSTAINGENQPVTKTMNFLMMPDDLLLNCLARVPRLYYPTLSLVSKKFRSLLASLECYNTRTLLGCTESCLYVCLQFPQDVNQGRWFTLCRRPTQITYAKPNTRWFTSCFALFRTLMNRIMKKDEKLLVSIPKEEENFLVSIPTHNPPNVNWWGQWGLIAVGCNIYKLGGYIDTCPTSRVYSMDCRSHTWHEAPSMRVYRRFPNLNVLDGKIYVVDSFKDMDPADWVECFDPITQKWDLVPSADAEIRGSFVYRSLAIQEKLYVFGDKCLVYKPKENRWDAVGLLETYFGGDHGSSCVIDNVLYRWEKKLGWYDFEGGSWRVLTGLEKLPKLPEGDNCVRLVDYGGKIAVLWEIEVGEEKKIWCAEISLERCNEREIRGEVEWCDVVLTVHKSCTFLQCLAVTV